MACTIIGDLVGAYIKNRCFDSSGDVKKVISRITPVIIAALADLVLSLTIGTLGTLISYNVVGLPQALSFISPLLFADIVCGLPVSIELSIALLLVGYFVYRTGVFVGTLDTKRALGIQVPYPLAELSLSPFSRCFKA